MSRRRQDLPAESGAFSRIFARLLVLVLVLPILTIVLMSLSSSAFVAFPPQQISSRWFVELATDPRWGSALRNSAVVGLGSSLVSTICALLAALGIRGYGRRARRVFEAVFLLPMIVPAIVLALALFPVYVTTGLLGSMRGLVIVHALLGFPYAYLVLAASVRGLDPRLELASASLGANDWQTHRHVILPNLAPAIAAAALVSLVISFDEVVVTLFLSSPSTRTLPVVMWSFVREELRPTLAAASVGVLALNLLVLAGLRAALSARSSRLRRARSAVGPLSSVGADA